MSRLKPPRGGFADLALVAVAVLAMWTRTPVGGLAQWGYSALTHGEDTPSLVSFFHQKTAPRTWVEQDTPELPRHMRRVPEGGFPEPYRSAVVHAVGGDLPEAVAARLGEGEAPVVERLLTWLDDNYEGDPEATLEILAIGVDQRDRAVARAVASGEDLPELYDVHRRYLPSGAARVADGLVGSTMALSTVLDLHWPVDPKVRISSPFGYRTHPVTGEKGKFHNGVDLPVPVGTPIRNAQSGVLKAVATNDVSGNYIIVDHGYGVRTAYCHLSEHPAKGSGGRVSKGELIGKSGNTGRSTGPHLHFVVRIDGKPVDPERYFRKR